MVEGSAVSRVRCACDSAENVLTDPRGGCPLRYAPARAMPEMDSGGPNPLAERLREAEMAALDLFVVYLGERLGLYRALAEGGPATSAELARRTGTEERYVR